MIAHPASWPNSCVTLLVSHAPPELSGFFEPYNTLALVITIQGGIKPALVSVIIIQGGIKHALAFSGGLKIRKTTFRGRLKVVLIIQEAVPIFRVAFTKSPITKFVALRLCKH